MSGVTDGDRERAAELYLGCRKTAYHRQEATAAIAAALATAREEGRQSVGLGDFMPDPCDEEKAAPNWHFVESYGDWLPCTLGRGHRGHHEHEESGLTWTEADA